MHRLLCIALLLPLFSFVYAQDTTQREFKTTAGKKLEMDLKTGGSIHVTGWDRNTVSVKVRGIEDSNPRPTINFEERSTGVLVTSRFSGSNHGNSHSNLEFEVQVPKKYDLRLESMGGDFTIQGVAGTMGGKTMGGALELEGLKGNLDLVTMGGKITLKNSDVNGYVKTMGGKVLVDHVSGNVKATSQGGDVTQRYVTTSSGDKPTGEVQISSMGGDINVEQAPAGADVHTMGGNVYVKSASDHVKAKTMGGNIEIETVDGRVSATTMGGDIEVTMTGDPSKGDRGVSLQSMGGDIALTVPPALSMDVNIELAYTKDSHRNYKIISDFGLKQEESPEWDQSQGSPRKYIYGTGTIGDGKNKIRIKTINGDVKLKKGT
jgi:DUF4097 and DUF4098 domain-containing protein YvlB